MAADEYSQIGNEVCLVTVLRIDSANMTAGWAPGFFGDHQLMQPSPCRPIFYIRVAGRRARSARRPAVQNVSVIAQGHGGGHASPIEAAGQWFY